MDKEVGPQHIGIGAVAVDYAVVFISNMMLPFQRNPERPMEADLETETLEQKLEVGALSQVNYVNDWNISWPLVFVGNEEDQIKLVLWLHLTAVVMMGIQPLRWWWRGASGRPAVQGIWQLEGVIIMAFNF